MNLRRLANKLQLALSTKGRHIKINQFQNYSERTGKMVTKYVLSERKTVKGKSKNVTIMETYRMADVVRKLADLYGEANEVDK